MIGEKQHRGVERETSVEARGAVREKRLAVQIAYDGRPQFDGDDKARPLGLIDDSRRIPNVRNPQRVCGADEVVSIVGVSCIRLKNRAPVCTAGGRREYVREDSIFVDIGAAAIGGNAVSADDAVAI